MNRRDARAPPRRSTGSACPSPAGRRPSRRTGCRCLLQVRPVGGAHHAVPEPVGRRLELDRHERLRPGAAGRSAGRSEDGVDHRLADDQRQELVQDEPVVVPGRQPPSLGEGSTARRCPWSRAQSTALLWNRMNAHCRPAIIRFSSFLGSGMIAVLSLVREILELAAGLDPELCPVGRVVELRARHRAAAVDRVEVERRRPRVRGVLGAVGTPSGEVVSKVMSWSTNWPKKVVPAVWVGLFGLFALSTGSMISRIGPLARSSCASRGPPLAPISRSAP